MLLTLRLWGENLQHTYSKRFSANAPAVLVEADCLPARTIFHQEAGSMSIHLAIQRSEGAQPGSRTMATIDRQSKRRVPSAFLCQLCVES